LGECCMGNVCYYFPQEDPFHFVTFVFRVNNHHMVILKTEK
jgi:hypothetical protein